MLFGFFIQFSERMDNPIWKPCSGINNCLSFKKMNKIKLYDRIVLAADLSDSGFKAGDVGTVVEIYNDGEAFEVEFFALDGSTLAIKTVPGVFVKPVSSSMMLHIRELAA